MSNIARVRKEYELYSKWACDTRKQGKPDTADLYDYVASVLFALSATSGDVSPETCEQWAAEERMAFLDLTGGCLYAADVLDHMAKIIRGAK